MIEDIRKFKITYILIALNLLVYLTSILYTGTIIDMPVKELVDLGAIFGPSVALGNEWWRLITAMFLHGGMTHLLMNMFSLYIIGRPTEIYFSASLYLFLYFMTGILSGVVSIYFHPVTVAIGASGAIFGLFGALSGYFFAYRQQLGEHAQQFMKDFALIIGINLILGFSIPNIDVSAHASGLISGLIGGYLIAKHPRKIWILLFGTLLLLLTAYLYLPTLYADLV